MATKKTTKLSADEKFENTDFDLFKAIEAIDRKDYAWFSKLTEEQRAKFVPYMITHWISAVKSGGTLGAYYVMSVDSNANKHLFNDKIQGHPELQWLMLCAASPGMGKQFHQWIPHLNVKYSKLKEKITKKEVVDYLSKVCGQVDSAELDQASEEYRRQQNFRYRLAQLYPEMKVEDIELLSNTITEKDLEEYEKESGN